MKNLLLFVCIPLFLAGTVNAADNFSEKIPDTQSSVISDDLSSFDHIAGQKDFKKEIKKLKRKAFFQKLNPFQKAEANSDVGNFIVAFILGFLLGIIGILIAFLIYLKHENRKQIMRFAWLGWLWWLVIFSIILLAV